MKDRKLRAVHFEAIDQISRGRGHLVPGRLFRNLRRCGIAGERLRVVELVPRGRMLHFAWMAVGFPRCRRFVRDMAPNIRKKRRLRWETVDLFHRLGPRKDATRTSQVAPPPPSSP